MNRLVGAKVWVVTGHSESGDDFGPLVFVSQPHEAKQREIALDWDSNEELDGPGDFGSYVFLQVDEAIIEALG